MSGGDMLTRRSFLARAGTALAAGTLAGCAEEPDGRLRLVFDDAGDDWEAVRRQFDIARDRIHMAGLLLAAHPRPVREAIARHRRGLDRDPAGYVEENNARLEREVRRAAGEYLGADARDIALTDSTTMGLGLVYNAIRVRPGQELLTTAHDYYSTREALAYKAQRSGATFRLLAWPDDVSRLSEDDIVARIIGAIRPATRVLALTWVHSSTGLKIPLRSIAEALERVNAGRAEEDRVLLGVDGVHALGVEPFHADELGCDFFIAGTHKWLFGPRGTGIVWAHPRAQDATVPIIPTFTWRDGSGARMTPGGFHSFEHRWALAEAFDWHRGLGHERVARRIRELAQQLKEGLAAMPHVALRTPMDERLSAGIVCFDVDGLSPAAVVRRLRERGIVASETPYAPSHARLAPGLLNTPEEVEGTLRAVRELA
ncbi:MAG TPA: aminotransferase class V-fold PLP-dependent enzyme [Longimicrobiales bacterium]